MNSKFRKALVIVAGALICGSSAVMGAELKMIGNPGMSEIMANIAPEFERNTGHRIRWDLGLFQKLKPVIDQRDFDVIVTTGEVADYAANQKAVIGDLVSVAQVGIGVAIKKGAPKPDISTVEAFKNTLLAAKSISYERQYCWQILREFDATIGHCRANEAEDEITRRPRSKSASGGGRRG